MAEPKIARAGHAEVDLEPGVGYLWCAYGRQTRQPLCDDPHEGTEFQPKPIEGGQALRLYLRGCSYTNDTPNYDGSHAGL